MKTKVCGKIVKNINMKKSVFTFLAASLLLVACQIEIVDPSESNVSADMLSAHIEQDEITKTELGESNNVLWSANDQIIAFMKSSFGYKYQIKPSYAGKTYAYFSKISSASGDDLAAGMEWEHIVAYYPYSESIECVKSGDDYALEVMLPAEQTYEENSFGNGTFPMLAVSEDNNITFKNVCGGMKLQLKGTQIVKSITLQGKNNEKLSGAATVTAYTDETKPAIVMAQDASTTVTMNCGEGIKLNESTATEFIIALPPMLFSQGFTVNVTDAEEKTYTVSTDKANTILRSSLLTMPAVKLDSAEGEPDTGVDGTVPVGKVTVNPISLTLTSKFSYTLTAKVIPVDATDQSVAWSSDNASVVTVDQYGVITTVSSGTANITAEAGGVTGTCKIIVIAPTAVASADYVDEFGVNHGKGTVIGGTVWAPVNCGYKAATSGSKGFPYGKLYQWGRKYGQGYSTSYDESVPEILEGPISSNEQKDTYSNTFYSVSEYPYDWLYPQNDQLWNSGTEESPVKTAYDPCPKGWRVPTYVELNKLCVNKSNRFKTTVASQKGYYFSGDYTYLDGAPQVFFPVCGSRSHMDGDTSGRGESGYYWSSRPRDTQAYDFMFSTGGSIGMMGGYRTSGRSVRCVQE